MSRLIFVPQYPTKLRYQEWWFHQFLKEFDERDLNVVLLGKEFLHNEIKHYSDPNLFSPLNRAVQLELVQITEYLSLEINESDVLFLSDMSYPGFFANVLFHKKPPRVFCFCHATSRNYLDYFSDVAEQKFKIETAIANMCNKVFVGSHYHKNKLNNLGWNNVVVTYVPMFNLMKEECKKHKRINREHLIMSASRNNPQKIDFILEKRIENKYGKIFRPQSKSWSEYCSHLGNSKILLITSFEDTFGYQIIDGYLHGCVVLAPKRCAYPEILPPQYLYGSESELDEKIEMVINGKLTETVILCEEQMKNFYNKLMEEMF